MDSYKVEYLSIISSKEEFCRSISSFNNFLQSYDNIEIFDQKIKFKEFTFLYSVQFEEIAESAQRFFHLKFFCDDKAKLSEFKLMLRSVRALLSKAGGKPPEVLWDDISAELSRQAYPVIHELESLMRKLITKFMFIKIGMAWTKDAVPKEVADSIKTKRETSGNNYLYEVDFIQLSHFLFRAYSTANSRKLVDKLSAAKNIEDLDFAELQELVPRSNWERYFSPIVDCKIEYLQTRWEKLYDLRCLVAHNNLITDAHYDEICSLSQEVKDRILQALEGLDKVQVSVEQKEEVAENIAAEISADFGDYIYQWNIISDLISHLSAMRDSKEFKKSTAYNIASPALLAAGLFEHGVISKEVFEMLCQCFKLRNYLVHGSTSEKTQIYLQPHLTVLSELKSYLLECIETMSARPIQE
ncbi:HEPN domain-containing protein [Pseudomonas syringae]|uniref:HEPN domain-containing protein n=1 Tax=Pseudomonas syringae TaxID=317 RepID=UPI001F0E3F8D|nr:HEPN domain-containing protein [Pseudomonas syringae]MCH5571203.1 HEPN domain-containing protein [Pseudomonas syringae pv. syringae]